MPLLPRTDANHHFQIPYRSGYCPSSQPTLFHPDKSVSSLLHLPDAHAFAVKMSRQAVSRHKAADSCCTAQLVAQTFGWSEHTSGAAGWLQERLENLYKQDPGYSDKAASLFMLDLQSPQELPDNLRGEQWNFVQLPLSALLEELSQVKQVCTVNTHYRALRSSSVDSPIGASDVFYFRSTQLSMKLNRLHTVPILL